MKMKECPYCGCGSYYTKYTLSGFSVFIENFDGSEADNGSMYEGANHKLKSKYAFCFQCNKKLFKVEQ